MKALFLDYMCWEGHKMFDSIHIDALDRIGCRIVLAGREGFFDQQSVGKAEETFYLPDAYFKTRKVNLATKVAFRLDDIHKLHLVAEHFHLADFDFVFVPTYDIATLSFFAAPCPIYVYDHSTEQFSNPAKRMLQKWGGNKGLHHLVPTLSSFNAIRQAAAETRVHVLPHGLCHPYCDDMAGTDREAFIFCPISATSQCDFTLLETILQSEQTLSYLEENDINIVVKTTEKTMPDTSCHNKRIIHIEGYLETREYRSLLLRAMAVFLPYDTTFQNRVSGIFHECLSNATPVITSKIAAFDGFDTHINYPFRIDSPAAFLATVEVLRHTATPYSNLQQLQPDTTWQQLIHTL